MFAVIYRWKLVPGREAMFEDGWRAGTAAIPDAPLRRRGAGQVPGLVRARQLRDPVRGRGHRRPLAAPPRGAVSTRMTTALLDLLRELEQFGEANDAATEHRSQKMLNITHDTGAFLALLVKAAR